MPNPLELLKQARAELPRVSATELVPVIVELRAKGFSYREISGWLDSRGIAFDHNAVYRACRNFHPANSKPTDKPPHPRSLPTVSPTEAEEFDSIKLL